MTTHKAIIIRRKNDMTLVEWNDGNLPKRAWVVPDRIESEDGVNVEVIDPEEGVPYGVEFSRMVVPSVTPEDIERELKRRNIWTVDDLRSRRGEVISALKAAYGIDFAELLRAAEKFEKELNTEAHDG